MKIMKRIRRSKYALLSKVIPITFAAAGLKYLCYHYGIEILPKEMISLFPSILTGIIFLLGFLLAGVVTDFKESEKLPNEIVTSLYIIWQEAEFVWRSTGSVAAKDLMTMIKNFVPKFKESYFFDRDKSILLYLNSFTDDFLRMEKEMIPAAQIRVRNEQSNLKKYINRITVIKETNFAPSVFAMIKLIVIIFILMYILLHSEPWWGGVLVVAFFSFLLSTVIFLIDDLDDPFEYERDGQKPDEISLDILYEFHEEINKVEL